MYIVQKMKRIFEATIDFFTTFSAFRYEHTMEPIRIENESKVVSFYTGKNILITGATGFMGKVLIEKLLRTCKGVGRIYLMVRQKKGKTIEQRTQTLFGEEVST